MEKFKVSKSDDHKLKFSCKFEDCFELTRGLITDGQLNAILYAPEMYNFLISLRKKAFIPEDKNPVILVNLGDLTDLINKINGITEYKLES